jgi:hypothetical protein
LSAPLIGYRFHDATATKVYNSSTLTRLYSSIEFKLALAAKTPSVIQLASAFLSVFQDLASLLLVYRRSSSDAGDMRAGPSVGIVVKILVLVSAFSPLLYRLQILP